jgi:predicted GNAT family acetyltransferase
MDHPLDRPAWSALNTRHAQFARGGALAKRYDPSIVPFAATAADDPASLHALAEIVPIGDSVLFAQADEIVLPQGFTATTTAQGVQMVASQSPAQIEDERIEPLAETDAPEMLALAMLTRPGPFSLRAQRLGRFWGIRIDGRIAAMAGERMKQPGLTELSGVCSHPDFRGQGLARVLSLFVAQAIFAGGDTPYLHAYATNAAAIKLYESIGFKLRRTIGVVMAQRQG